MFPECIAMEFYIELPEIGRRVRFVDRVLELDTLRSIAERGYLFPIAIYGPEGCGKTTVLRYTVHSYIGREDSIVLYVDALEERDVRRALLSTFSDLWRVVEEVVKTLPIGSEIARSLTYIVRLLAERIALKGRGVLIAVDDVFKAIGLENVDRYVKALYEFIDYLHREYGVRRVAIILATSESVSRRELLKHTYVHVYMLWNLPKQGFKELVEQLQPPPSIDVEDLWRLTGGNPRALIEIAQLSWDIDRWIRLVEDRVLQLVEGIDRARLQVLTEDPDSDPSTARLLEERNLMIGLSSNSLGFRPARALELGIGERWAWQLPIYRDIAEKLSRSLA